MILFTGDAEEQLSEMRGNMFQCCVTSPPYYGLRDYKAGDYEIGSESSVEAYVKRLGNVLREVYRVLRVDGTFWLNLGYSYNAYNGNRGKSQGVNKNNHEALQSLPTGYGLTDPEFKNKDLLGVPWRVAFEAQRYGFHLRSDIIWHKPNPMPESVTDRPTRSHEYLFLLTESKNYYYNNEAVKEQAVGGQSGKAASFKRTGSKREQAIPGQSMGTHRPEREEVSYNGDTRNLRDVWTISTKPYRGAHFAVFPEALVEPCILAGTQPGDLVLDPFMGSGTVGVVCARLDRVFTGIDLNPEYVALAESRISGVQPG